MDFFTHASHVLIISLILVFNIFFLFTSGNMKVATLNTSSVATESLGSGLPEDFSAVPTQYITPQLAIRSSDSTGDFIRFKCSEDLFNASVTSTLQFYAKDASLGSLNDKCSLVRDFYRIFPFVVASVLAVIPLWIAIVRKYPGLSNPLFPTCILWGVFIACGVVFAMIADYVHYFSDHIENWDHNSKETDYMAFVSIACVLNLGYFLLLIFMKGFWHII